MATATNGGTLTFGSLLSTRECADLSRAWRGLPADVRLQEVMDLLLADVDRWPDVFDLERAPEPFVDLILADLGNPFPFELDAMGKRRLASNVEVARLLTDRERRQLRAIVEYLKPAHTHFVDLVEPQPLVLPDHWELGLSDLGDTTFLH